MDIVLLFFLCVSIAVNVILVEQVRTLQNELDAIVIDRLFEPKSNNELAREIEEVLRDVEEG